MLDKKKTLTKRISVFWEKYEIKVVLIIGLALIAVLSFEFGALQGQKWQQKPLVIEKFVENTQTTLDVQQSPPVGSNLAPEGAKTPLVALNSSTPQISPGSPAKCLFFGSKNSNKYHTPTCRWAKQIKPENVVCFASAEAASAKGYLPDKNCVK